jgi:hypothetical protein
MKLLKLWGCLAHKDTWELNVWAGAEVVVVLDSPSGQSGGHLAMTSHDADVALDLHNNLPTSITHSTQQHLRL